MPARDRTSAKIREHPTRADLCTRLEREFEIIDSCAKEVDDGVIAMLATHPEERYPYVYPRDVAACAHLLRGISETDLPMADRALELLEGISAFLCRAQSKSGLWGQRYDLNAEDRSVYVQEDCVAHGMIIQANYLLACLHRGEHISQNRAIVKSLNLAAEYALKNFYRSEANLFISTTSIHESSLESGYTLWVNCAYLRAFVLASEVHSLLRKSRISQKILRFKPAFEEMIYRRLHLNGRYIRRILLDGNVDLRPDITLLSPFYFGFGEVRPELQRASVDYLVEHLWDPVLGMIQRYVPFGEDLAIHLHAGPGPWIQYSAILGRYWWSVGEHEKALDMLDRIDAHRTEEGYIPEHLSTSKRFRDFMEREWETGLDFRKEFAEDILIPGLSFDLILEELNNMARSYHAIEKSLEGMEHNDRAVIHFACPLMWAHVEYAKALMAQLGIELPR